LLAAVFVAGCDRSSPSASYSHSQEVMGTLATLTAVAPNPELARAAVDAGYAKLEAVERQMSDYREDSEIGRLNHLEPGRAIALSPETFECVQTALQVAEASGGAFDVTCRPLIGLWKEAASAGRPPTDEQIVQAVARVGWHKIELNAAERTVHAAAIGVQVDLGGIAKGFSLDLAAQAMKRAGAAASLGDVGGDVLATGRQAGGRPWRVGIQHPFKAGVISKLELVDRAVATSGVQQRFFEIEGRRYSHIVDPRTGRPAAAAPCVTVIASDGMTADAWATAFSVLSIEEGKALLAAGKTPGVEVLWITGSAEAPKIEKTAGFDRYLFD